MYVKTAGRTLDLFETFAREARPLSLSELGRRLAMPMSSCFGLVRTLQARGYLVETGPRAGWYPTKRLLAIATTISAHDRLLDRLDATLEALRDATGETVVLGKLEGQRVVYLDVRESRQTIRYSAQIGEQRDPHANSIGKALLAAMAPEARRAALAGYRWTRHTPRTLASPEALEADLAAGAARGWFANVGESLPDIAGIARALRVDGEAVAISVAGPLYRMEARLEAHAGHLLAACAAAEAPR